MDNIRKIIRTNNKIVSLPNYMIEFLDVQRCKENVEEEAKFLRDFQKYIVSHGFYFVHFRPKQDAYWIPDCREFRIQIIGRFHELQFGIRSRLFDMEYQRLKDYEKNIKEGLDDSLSD